MGNSRSERSCSSRKVKRRAFLVAAGALLASGRNLIADLIAPLHKVTLPEAHRGTLEVDTRLLDSYGRLPESHRRFYLESRELFEADRQADFSSPAMVACAQRQGLMLMGGPLLGDLADDGATFWLRPATSQPISIRVGERTLEVPKGKPGQSQRVKVSGLKSDHNYRYSVWASETKIAEGGFRTAPQPDAKGEFRIAFGSCCHKIGVHNPNLFREILLREPQAMLLLGDIAVDDRNNQINMHRADYQLRDVSLPWRQLVANVPVFASWDDHDYFDNDLSGVPKRFSPEDRDAVRAVWRENWNNPPAPADQEGIYFRTRMGPVEVIMLDTRSCRTVAQRREYGSYLGLRQMTWLKQTLKQSTAPFKIVSSGTMWSDYVSKGKDSWGTWDTKGREEIFDFVEREKIGGVLLVSGDRHGARGFRIPRPSGFSFYEFEPATLGGASGPPGKIKNCPEQLFGYDGKDFVAFGEFTFDTREPNPIVTFRLISQAGRILEELPLNLRELTPGHGL